MKKVFIIGFVIILLLVACGRVEDTQGDISPTTDGKEKNTLEEEKEPEDKKQDEKPGESTETKADSKGFEFVAKGVTIGMNDKMEDLLPGLGQAVEYFEADSCALPGKEKIYTYSGFEIHTYEDNGDDRVLSILILDDSIPTKEGVYLYSDFDSLMEKYGDNYVQELSSYKYERDKSQLVFLIEDDEVTSIEYMAIMK